jgi:hypothetical protein
MQAQEGSMILHRYSRNDGSHVWTRGKTDALVAARKHAKQTSNEQTLLVEAVVLKDLTTKTLILALLNGESVIEINEDDEEVSDVIAEIKGKLKAKKKATPPPPEPVAVDAPLEVEGDGEDAVVMRWTSRGYSPARISSLRKGDKIATTNGKPAATVAW